MASINGFIILMLATPVKSAEIGKTAYGIKHISVQELENWPLDRYLKLIDGAVLDTANSLFASLHS